MEFSSTTDGASIVYAFASSTVNLIDVSLPFWTGWFGLLIGFFAGLGVVFGVFFAIQIALGRK